MIKLKMRVYALIALLFTLIAFVTLEEQISLLGAILLGGCLGFLIFNFHPAKIFMGDTVFGLLCSPLL